jgi:hypothetical protein
VRDALVEVLDAMEDVDGADFEFFEESLFDERGFVPQRGGAALEQVAFVASVARGLLVRMGAIFDERGVSRCFRTAHGSRRQARMPRTTTPILSSGPSMPHPRRRR